MARRIPNAALPHKDTSFKPYLGSANGGRGFGPSQPVPRALVVEKSTMVTNSKGEQQKSSTQVYTDATNIIPLLSQYTVFGSTAYAKTAAVVAVALFDHPRVEGFIVVYLE